MTWRGRSVADVLALTVTQAAEVFADVPGAARSLTALVEVGVGHLRLGQPATELSAERPSGSSSPPRLQRAHLGHTLYLLDEPTSGLHPADVALLLHQLHRLVDAGNTVVLVEHDMDVVAGADWVVDLGPGGGATGGRVVAAGRPARWPGPPRAGPRRTSPVAAPEPRRCGSGCGRVGDDSPVPGRTW